MKRSGFDQTEQRRLTFSASTIVQQAITAQLAAAAASADRVLIAAQAFKVVGELGCRPADRFASLAAGKGDFSRARASVVWIRLEPS